jgi:hypothetical protein
MRLFALATITVLWKWLLRNGGGTGLLLRLQRLVRLRRLLLR